MREIVHLQAGQCGNQIGAKVRFKHFCSLFLGVVKAAIGFLTVEGALFPFEFMFNHC